MPEVPLKKYWVSHPKFTGQVCTELRNEVEVIIQAPPVWKGFLSQPLSNLVKWLNKLGPGLKMVQFTH